MDDELILTTWSKLEDEYSFDRNELVEELGANDLRSAVLLIITSIRRASRILKTTPAEMNRIAQQLIEAYIFTPLEIKLNSFNYKEFIPFVRTLRFEHVDTLFKFLEATLDGPPPMGFVKLVQKLREEELGVDHADHAYLVDSMSPTVAKRHKNCSDLEEYLANHESEVEDAARSIVQHPKAEDLHYTLSSQTEPDPQPQRLIQDKVHGNIEFPKWMFEAVIDTEPVQRLRNVAQLGLCYRVYPSGNHSRFDHSLGVGHLAISFFDRLLQTSGYRHDRETWRVRNCLAIAGITHDLGHGPFSHTFETAFINDLKDESKRTWRHEKMSEKLLDMICESPKLAGFPHDDIQLIKNMIQGDPPSFSGRTWCSDTPESLLTASCSMISNKKCGIDVDRFDYLQRDQMIGDNLKFFKANRIMEFAKIINGEICFRDKEHDNVFKMFESRYYMFKWVYTHPKVRAFESMTIDALKEVDPLLHFSSCIEDENEFLLLTDSSITERIKWLKPKDFDDEDGSRARVQTAQELLKRMDRRDIYRFCGEVEISEKGGKMTNPNFNLKNIQEKFTPSVVRGCASPSDGNTLLPESDIIVDWNSIDYGMKNENPMDKVSFYSKNDDTRILRHKSPYDTNWQSHSARVYCRNNRYADVLKDAFENWTKEYVPEGARHSLAYGGSRDAAQSPSCPRTYFSSTNSSLKSPKTFPQFPCLPSSDYDLSQ